MKYKRNNRPGTGGPAAGRVCRTAGRAGTRPQQTAKAAETQSGVTFTDAMGYPVTVQSWNRVVSLYGSFAEAWTLAGGTLTATTEDAIKERGLDLGTDIAVIGTNQDPNTEEILAQNPDFVILNAEVSEQTALHEFLQEAGCRTPISKPIHLMNTLLCCALFVI